MTAKPGQTCIVLAGGFGTRLRDTISGLPKALAPIGGQSFLSLQLRHLHGQGIAGFVLSLGYLAEQIVSAVEREKLDFPIQFVTEDSPLGTGGAVLNALSVAGLDECLVANGDSYVEGALTGMLEPLDQRGGELMRLAAVWVEDRHRYGGLAVSGTRVTGFVEKGDRGAGLINAGLYRVGRQAFGQRVPGDPFSLEAAVMPDLAQSDQLSFRILSGKFTDIGVPDDYFAFCGRHAPGSRN